jgi:uncharacterized protein (DUF2384 family)
VAVLAEEPNLDALRQVDEALGRMQQLLEAAVEADAVDREQLERVTVTGRELAGRLNRQLPPAIDPDARDEIRRRIIDLLVLSPEETDDARLLDTIDRALVEVEAIRHILRDLVQEQPPVHMRSAAQVIRLLQDWLPRVTQKQLAELVGVSPRQWQRLRQSESPTTPRMQRVARLVAILRHAWTDEGVVAWFYRPRRDLDARKPADVIDDPAYEAVLMRAARSGRVQGGG